VADATTVGVPLPSFGARRIPPPRFSLQYAYVSSTATRSGLPVASAMSFVPPPVFGTKWTPAPSTKYTRVASTVSCWPPLSPDTSTVDARGTQPPSQHTSLAAHAWPHAPQLATSTLSETHTPPHGCMPGRHRAPHCPPAHVAAPPVGTGQAWPQAPQFPGSVSSLPQPLLQVVQPAGHVWLTVPPHTPPLHAVPAHAFVHEPQCRGSLVRSTHEPLQFVSGGVQVSAQPLGAHTCPVAHAMLHAPHVAGLRKLASQPFETTPSQSAQVATHCWMAHLPALHVG